MSGIYIPGMEMQKRCLACQLNYDSCACILTGSRYYKHCVEFDPGEERLPDCPLVAVPDHGRLIDADALEELFREVIGNISKRDEIKPVLEHMVRASAMAVEMIKDAPTIIPADKEGET